MGKRLPICWQSLLIVGLVISAMLASPVAMADDAADLKRAKVLFKKAELHFKLGEFKEALPLYKEAYRLKPLSGFLFNLGQCHRYLGNCDRANFFFRQFITDNPKSPHVPEIKRLMESCKPAKPKKPAPAPAPPAEKPPAVEKPPAAEKPPVVEKPPVE